MDNAQSNYENDWDPLKRVFFKFIFKKKINFFIFLKTFQYADFKNNFFFKKILF
jgi:hypothetical protein